MVNFVKKTCTVIRLLPLLFILKINQWKKTSKAQLWKMDCDAVSQSTLALLTYRPYYRMLLYYRLGVAFTLGQLLWGKYPVSISCPQIGGGLWLEHPFGTILNAKAIGENFKVMHFVTLGQNKGGIPTIGNNVFCGVGSCVLGDIRIGNNVNIGANAVVLKDVPDNCTVIGNPARIVKMNGERVSINL